MTALETLAGVGLIALVTHDVFSVLFRSGTETRLSGALVRTVWVVLRRFGGRRALSLAGPVALAAVIWSWALLLVLGWTLIYLPHYPHDFALANGARSPFLGALHVSLATITTLGSSNASPKPAWLQVVTPIEALIGFGLLTAAVAYLFQLFPVLSRRRSLAYEIHLLARTEQRLGLHAPSMEAAAGLYAELTSRLIAVERDLVKFPFAYYFAETDSRFALWALMPELVELARRGTQAENPAPVRLRASMLEEAIDDFVVMVAERFLAPSHHSTAEALRAFARDHRHRTHAPREKDDRHLVSLP